MCFILVTKWSSCHPKGGEVGLGSWSQRLQSLVFFGHVGQIYVELENLLHGAQGRASSRWNVEMRKRWSQ